MRPTDYFLKSAVGIGELVGFRISLTLGVNSDRNNFLLFNRTITRQSLSGSDCIYNFHTGGYLAESGILTVQMLGILMHDEELAAGTVGRLASCHTQYAALVTQVMLQPAQGAPPFPALARATPAGGF